MLDFHHHDCIFTCVADALKHKILGYSNINIDANVIANINHCITNKTPVLIAIMVYDSFESNNTAITGIVSIPNTSRESLLGGHEMCLVGYDNSKQSFIVLNSWGNSWGDRGYCYIPYQYLSNPNLCVEITTITL